LTRYVCSGLDNFGRNIASEYYGKLKRHNVLQIASPDLPVDGIHAGRTHLNEIIVRAGFRVELNPLL